MKKLTCYLTLLLIFSVLSIASSEAATEITSLPYTINSSGSYYINRNLSSTRHGIIVNKNHVTIDLRGHTISGSGTGNYHGIYMNGRTNVEIKDGTIKNFGLNGIYEASNSGNSHRVINVRVIGNYGSGIYLNGNNHLIEGCTASFNSGSGIWVGDGCTVINNTTYNNGNEGIDTYGGCTISGNTAYNNGYCGIEAGSGCTITGNNVYSNEHCGLTTNYGSTVKNNTAYYNQRDGIVLGDYDLVDGNTAYNNNQSGGSYTNISTCATCIFGTNSAP